ncbi:MAG: protein kinase [Streptomycetaceae bacterium]|nr:protein kinase [Streptomycetaceae bacterium]
MGRVYLAHSPAGLPAAVKRIRGGAADDPDFRARFRREVAAVRAVEGRFTAALLDAGPDDELPWMATEYVAGPALDRAVRESGPFPPPTVLVLAEGLVRALIAIHSVGLVHRDLKPSNVILAADGPRVIDFGISRATDATTLTWTGQLVGSAGYMAPEQVRGEPVGVPGDVFSLGATLVFASRGSGPFGRTDNVEPLLVRTLTEDPDLTGVPADVAQVAAACLAKDPAQRPTPDELLATLAAGEPPTAADWLPEEVRTTLDGYTAPPADAVPARLSRPGGAAADAGVAAGDGTGVAAPTRSRRRFLKVLGAATLTVGAGVAAVPLVRRLNTDDRSTDDTPSAPVGQPAPRHPDVPRAAPRWTYAGLATEPQFGVTRVLDPNDIEGTRSTHFLLPGLHGDWQTRQAAVAAVRLNDGTVTWRAELPQGSGAPMTLGPVVEAPPNAAGDLLHLGSPIWTLDTKTGTARSAGLPYDPAKLARTGPSHAVPGGEITFAAQPLGSPDAVTAVHAGTGTSTLVHYRPAEKQGWAYGVARRVTDPRALAEGDLVFLADTTAQPVYAVISEGGKQAWTADLRGAQGAAGRVNGLLRAYVREGEASTLLVAADRVYALDTTDGRVRWSSAPTDGYTALTVLGDLVFAAASTGLIAWQLGTGKEAWRWAPDTPTVPALAAAAVWDGLVWFANGAEPHDLYGLQPASGRLTRLIERPAAPPVPQPDGQPDTRPGWKLYDAGTNLMVAAYGHVALGFQGLITDANGPVDPYPRSAVQAP